MLTTQSEAFRSVTIEVVSKILLDDGVESFNMIWVYQMRFRIECTFIYDFSVLLSSTQKES